MIITLILAVIFGIVNFIIGILPVGGLPTAVSTGMSSVVGYAYTMNGFFPIDTLLTLAGLALVLEGFVLLWHLAHIIFKYIRGN